MQVVIRDEFGDLVSKAKVKAKTGGESAKKKMSSAKRKASVGWDKAKKKSGENWGRAKERTGEKWDRVKERSSEKYSKMRSKSLGPGGRTPKRGDSGGDEKDNKKKLIRRRSFSFSRNSRYFHGRSRSRSKSREDIFPDPAMFQKKTTGIFGVAIEDLKSIKLADYDAEIPEVLVRLKDYLTNNNGIFADGIFRVNPGSKERDLVKQQINDGCFEGCEDIHCVSNMIKVFFRDLPDRIYDELDISDVQQAVEPKDIPRTTRVSQVILRMSEPERSIVLWLLDLCILITSNSDVNRMTPRNMAIVIAPNLWEPSKHDTMLFMSLNQTFTDFLEQGICWRASIVKERNIISERYKKMTLDRLDEVSDAGSSAGYSSDISDIAKKRVSFGENDIRTFESDVGSDEEERKSDDSGVDPVVQDSDDTPPQTPECDETPPQTPPSGDEDEEEKVNGLNMRREIPPGDKSPKGDEELDKDNEGDKEEEEEDDNEENDKQDDDVSKEDNEKDTEENNEEELDPMKKLENDFKKSATTVVWYESESAFSSSKSKKKNKKAAMRSV